MAIDPVRLLAVAKKEAIQLRRDRRSLILAFLLPLALLVIFGYAISLDVTNLSLAVIDQDASPASRALTERFAASGYFSIVAHPQRPASIHQLFVDGAAQLVLVIPPGFAAAVDRAAGAAAARGAAGSPLAGDFSPDGLASPAPPGADGTGSGQPAAVQIVVDGRDANTAEIASGYAQGVVAAFARGAVLGGQPAELALSVETRVWWNEALRSRISVVPGLIAVIMMIIAALLTSLTIAREWERGTMEQLASTPVSRLEVVLGKLLPYVVIGLVDVVATTLLGRWLFAVPLRGNVVVLAGLSFLFLCGALGLGLFLSAATRSQVLATQIAMIGTFVPAFLLSGFMFSIEVMPKPLQLVTFLVPARYFIVVTRGLFLKGVGPEVLWPQALFMLVFAVAGLGLAVRAFRKELG
jgi:ABC-2 type transport system permease protein